MTDEELIAEMGIAWFRDGDMRNVIAVVAPEVRARVLEELSALRFKWDLAGRRGAAGALIEALHELSDTEKP